jgi:hypothetical protein
MVESQWTRREFLELSLKTGVMASAVAKGQEEEQ